MAARSTVFWTFLIALSLLSACGSGSNSNSYNPEYARYFTGTEGIDASLVNVPQTLYYYGPEDNAGNEFSFGVEVKNKGASFSRGGIFISGFDPRMIVFREIPIAGGSAGACGLSLGSIAFGQVGGIFRCDGIEIAGNENFGSVRVDLSQLINGFAEKYDKQWWIPERFQFEYSDDGPNAFTVNWDHGYAEYYQHGRLFIGIMAALDFAKHNGQDIFLAGDTYEYPGGEYAYLIYNGKVANWPPGLDETQQTLLLTSCYLYTTFASPIVCIDPEPYSENRKVCQPQSRSYGGGNGAPVAITSIEQENTPRKTIFHINVKNVGGGTVYDSTWLEKCSPYYPGRVTPADLNVVYLGDVRIGSYGLASRGGPGGITCTPEVIRLDPNTGTGSTTCSYPIEFADLKSAYQTPLTVELWYGYSQVKEQKIRIKRIT